MITRRRFLKNSSAAIVGVAVGAGVVRKTMELQGTQTSRMLYRSYGGGVQRGEMLFYGRGGKSPLGRAVAKNLAFASRYSSGVHYFPSWSKELPMHFNCRSVMS